MVIRIIAFSALVLLAQITNAHPAPSAGTDEVESIQTRVSDPGNYDQMFSSDFSLGDIVDDPTLMIPTDIPSFNDSDSESFEIENDIPGFALDPEDFLVARSSGTLNMTGSTGETDSFQIHQ